MAQSSATGPIRILPNNKVYRQLFDAQVQLSETYNRVRTNQLSQSVNVISRSDGIPLVRNIRPHESQKRQWLTSMSYSNDSSINPIALLYQDEQKRRQIEQKQHLDELKREVFNLPDKIEYVPSSDTNETEVDENEKTTVTERLAVKREAKFNQLWNEILNKVGEINQNVISELEQLTRKCNLFYEQGDREITNEMNKLIYDKDITSLTIKSFENAFKQLNQCLSPRLSQIQEYCQSIEEVETERIQKIRDLFQSYSDPLYETHHLSETETAARLEKQANELNKQILDNRRTYAELEARLLTGETLRVHRYEAELVDYQNKWRDATWIIYKQTWISKLSICRAKLELNMISSCQSIGSRLADYTKSFIEHVNSLKLFLPPISTQENAQNWMKQGTEIVETIVLFREELMDHVRETVTNEINLLQNEYNVIYDKVRQTQVYNEQQTATVFERDIQPLFDERKRFLHESIMNRFQTFYENSTALMSKVLDRLFAVVQPISEQWDQHQTKLEKLTTQLLEMMREFRRPFDLQNEKKLTKLDSTLDEMRSASNDTALARLLASSYEQLDIIKSGYAQFYETEHSIVNKYPEMIAQEVERYKNEMLTYFRARPVEKKNDKDHEFYTSALAGKLYELNDRLSEPFESLVKPEITDETPSQKLKGSTMKRSRAGPRSRIESVVQEEKTRPPVRTFLTEELTAFLPIPVEKNGEILFHEAFEIPTDLVQSVIFHLRRAYIDHYDQWKEETIQRTEAVIHSKHDELDKEMDLQMHLHEPRRVRIETDIHNVRTAELVMHDERVERHIRGVQETLEQTDADYSRMLHEFGKTIVTYKENVYGLEDVFINATSSGRLNALQYRLTQQRDLFMEQIRTTLRGFRKRFDDVMQYLRQANLKFRKSFKTFADGGNFSREEIEVYRKKLEKTAFQIDKAESAILKEMEKLEKKQLEEATKIMNQFQERFKNHLVDLEFIELSNRWISETQVKIKSEVALSNQQVQVLKTLLAIYQHKIDAILNPNFDNEPSTLNEVRDLYHQIILATYERALYMKCLNNELIIPASLLPKLKQKGLITEEELINDLLHVSSSDELTPSRRPSRISGGQLSNSDEVKSVKFETSSTSLTKLKVDFPVFTSFNASVPEDSTTLTTIRTLLHKQESEKTDEVAGLDPNDPHAKSMISDSSSHSKHSKNSKHNEKRTTVLNVRSSLEEGTPATRSDGTSRLRTRDAIYDLYCSFGEKKQPGEDFVSRIMNILRSSIEGLLTHAELYYKEKGQRPVTRPQALREKFEDFGRSMVEKLKNYEEQCRTYHEQTINEFRDILEHFERLSSSIGKIELDQLITQAEENLHETKLRFDRDLEKNVTQSATESQKNYDLLRPNLGQPSRKEEFEQIDQRERLRQGQISETIRQLRSDTIEDIQLQAQTSINSFATSAELLLILFDEILTADEVKKPKMPLVRQSLLELVRRQQTGRPLEDAEPRPLIERKPGNWPGLPIAQENPGPRRESSMSKKRSSVTSQRHKTSATVITQKTTLPQIETVAYRDQIYQRYKELLNQTLADIEAQYSTVMVDLDRYQSFWNASIEKLQQLRTS